MRPLPDILYNFHWIVPGEAARSAQAYAGFLAPFLKAHDIATLINLRGANPHWAWWRYETRVCRQIGVTHCDVKLNSRRLPTPDMLLDLLRAFEGAQRPFLLKCSGGQDRTSFAAALYLLHTRGWNARQDAEAQFARWPYLHLPKQQQRWLRHFLTFIEEHSGPLSLREWIAARYTAEEFKNWLEARGLGSAFRGLYETRATVADAGPAA
jgi:protein tyrosine/serine phosphatase